MKPLILRTTTARIRLRVSFPVRALVAYDAQIILVIYKHIKRKTASGLPKHKVKTDKMP